MNRMNKLIKLKFKVIICYMFVFLQYFNFYVSWVSKRLENLKCSYTAEEKKLCKTNKLITHLKVKYLKKKTLRFTV